jgi:hypothetical protein
MVNLCTDAVRRERLADEGLDIANEYYLLANSANGFVQLVMFQGV